MFQILTVCTGNICRSPLAELLLHTRLADLDPTVSSAGTRGLNASPMTPEAQRLAAQLGATDTDIAAHRSRYLTEAHLAAPDLILTMTRDHRRHVAELAPTRLRSTFTVREFARLAEGFSDDAVRGAVASVADSDADASTRLRAAVTAVAARRGMVQPPTSPDDDDVIDPYRRSWATYELSAQQMAQGLTEVERIVRAAV